MNEVFDHVCNNDPNAFCFVCSKFIVPTRAKREITDDIRILYKKCYKLDMQDDGDWVPHYICELCFEDMEEFKRTGDKTSLPFTTPARWRQPQSDDDCYICNADIQVSYANVSSLVFPSNSFIKDVIYLNNSKKVMAEIQNSPEGLEIKENIRTSSNKIAEASIEYETSIESESETTDGCIDSDKKSIENECKVEIENETDDGSSDSNLLQFIPSSFKKEKWPKKLSESDLDNLVRKLELSKEDIQYLTNVIERKNLFKKRKKPSVFREKYNDFREFSPGGNEISSIYHFKKDVLINCIAHCIKCKNDTLAEKRRENCQICSSPLVYWCGMCKKKFFCVTLLKDHGLEKISSSIKCSKCHRSHFSTRCSLQRHKSNCNSPFSFDKEIIVKLKRSDSLE